MFRAFLQAWPFLAFICLGVALVAIVRPRPEADEHDLADYHEPEPDRQQLIREALFSLRDRSPMVLGPGATFTPLTLPPVPADSSVTPPLARRLLVDQAVPTLPDAAVRGIADEWLREIGDKARAQLELAR